MAKEVRVAHIVVEHFRQISLLDQQASSQHESMTLEINLRRPDLAG